MVSYHISKGEQLERLLERTFQELERVSDVREMTNAQLKRLVQKIEVDKEWHVDIYLRLMGELGLDETVLIYDDQTQGSHRAVGESKPWALCPGEGGAGSQ